MAAVASPEQEEKSQSPHFWEMTCPSPLTSVAHHGLPLEEWSAVQLLYFLPLKVKGKTHLRDSRSCVGMVLM